MSVLPYVASVVAAYAHVFLPVRAARADRRAAACARGDHAWAPGGEACRWCPARGIPTVTVRR